MSKLNLCILMGGSSNEREVSIFSAKEMLNSLDKSRYNIKALEIPNDHSTLWIKELIDHPPDIVLSALHGGLGENGSIQGLLECLHIPYVGSKVLSSAICMNKHMSKMIMRANHIPVPEDILIRQPSDIMLYEDNIINEIGFPFIIKPNSGGSSIDISVIHSLEELEKGVYHILNTGDMVLVEKYIKGQEVTVGIIEDDQGLSVMPVLDITLSTNIFDYESKYSENSKIIDFSGLPEFIKTMIQEIAKKAYILMECAGYANIDMIVHEEQITVIEMNTLPGLTTHSLMPKAASQKDGGFSGFLDSLITYAIEEKNKSCIH